MASIGASNNVIPIDAARIQIASGGGKIRLRPGDTAGTWDIVGVTTETYQGPQQPIIPIAQQPYLGAVGRQRDYQVGYNLNYSPAALNSIWTMRALRVNYDVLGLVIDNRKDQLLALEWSVQPKDKKAKVDDQCKKIQTFLEMPDPSRAMSYQDWGQALLDDMFVGDCMTIYPRMTNGGELYALEYIDGATIFPLIDAGGRRPLPPSPAYQQILKGVPAVDYTSDEIIYQPRKRLTWREFGFSPVEQILITVNIALRRQAFQLDYYQAGSIPDAFGTLPATWTTAQIAELQEYWDSKFENLNGQNSNQRRKMRWVPDGKITFAKDAVLKDMFDEWLARIVCYALSTDPTPFVAQVNRATAEQANQTALGDGLSPLKLWWASRMNYIIARCFKRPDLCFEWKEEESTSPLEQAQINQIYVSSSILTADEIREDLGRDPLPEDEKPENKAIAAAQAMASIAKPDGDQKPGDAQPADGKSEKLAKFAGERRNVMIQRQRLTRTVKRALKEQAKTIAAQAATHLGKAAATTLRKMDDPASDWQEWFDWDAIFAPMIPAVTDPLTQVSRDAVSTGLERLPKTVSSGISLGEFPNTYATDYADDRAAEMIGKRYVDGALVDNPDAKWAITDETREAVRKSITQGIADGWTLDEFSDNLARDYAFSPARADVIARTETRLADSRGQVAAWKESGVVSKKEWLLSEDNACDDCTDNANAGPIDIDDDFPSGDDAPPLHPNAVFAGHSFASYGRLNEMVGADYVGASVLIGTTQDKTLAIGPNHPILTSMGLVLARNLREGDDLVYDIECDNSITPSIDADLKQVPMIEDAFQTILAAGHLTRIPAASDYLHGDGVCCKGEIDVVKPADGLLFVREPKGIEKFSKPDFVWTDVESILLPRDCTGDLALDGVDLPAPGGVSGAGVRHFAFLRIQRIHYGTYQGRAFDASTSTGYYNCGGFVVKNCNCAVAPIVEGL